MSETTFQVRGLNLFYGDKQALFDVDMDIESHAITALIGPPGCGKSTFLRTLNRMNDLIESCRTTGEVLYQGQDIFAIEDVNRLRREVGMVFQKPNPFPMSIYDNITFALKSMGIRDKRVLDERVERSLKQSFLWEEVHDRLHENALSLSGGQQQRVCIARAIAVQPKVILLVTHNMQQAARCSDYTAFFLMGEVIEKNRTDVIFHSPKEQRTHDYVTGRFG